ncbi:hypothetical protein ACF1AB_22355 [Streptomyces sp. NPDC014846]|uniref:hypothetical protein n=1 Tax=Streptomyces sp. NPDC014846 TaxID=3364922 RepID=UPI0036FA83E5
MTGEIIAQTVTTVLVPIVTAAVGAAALMAQDRRKKRDFGLRHKMLVEEAQLEVQFISSWIQARKLLEPAMDACPEAESWLERCYRSAEDASLATQPTPDPAALRRLLVLWSLAGRAAKTVRAIYWISLAWVSFLIIAFIAALIRHGGVDDVVIVAEILVVIAMFTLLSVYLRHLCLTLDRNVRLGPKPSPAWPPSAWPQPSDANRSTDRKQ